MAMNKSGRVYAGGNPNFDMRTGKMRPTKPGGPPSRKPVPPGGKRPTDVTIMPVRPGKPNGGGMQKPVKPVQKPMRKPGVVRRPGTITRPGATSKPKKMGRYM